MSATTVGLFAIGLPALLIGGLLFMWWPIVQRLFVVCLLVGLGYLSVSGIATDIGTRVSAYLPQGVILPPASNG